MQLPFPFTRNTTPSSRSTTLTLTNVQRRAHTSASILLYDDAVVEGRDNTTPIMREMDDDYLIKSDNIDTPRLYLNVNLCVVSTVYPRERTVTQLLHKAEYR